jgi:hypothetical protein
MWQGFSWYRRSKVHVQIVDELYQVALQVFKPLRQQVVFCRLSHNWANVVQTGHDDFLPETVGQRVETAPLCQYFVGHHTYRLVDVSGAFND